MDNNPLFPLLQNTTTTANIVTPPLRNFTYSIFFCHFVDFPPDTRKNCSISEPDVCVKCPILGKYLSGGSLEEFGSTGHVLTLTEWAFTLLIGLFGIFTNSLIITIFQKRNSGRSFDMFLIALAWSDLIASITSVIGATTAVMMLENWNKGLFTQILVYYGAAATLFAKSASSFMTVMITAERYFVLAFPFKANDWFTKKNSKTMILVVFLFAGILGFPRFTSFTITSTKDFKDIPKLNGLDYIALTSRLQKFWHVTLHGFFDKIDFWVWPPLLIFLNILVFIEVRKFTKRREQLTQKQRKDIRAVKMFVPVVVALFICNIEPYIHYYYIAIERTLSREHYLGMYLSIVVNSSVNMPIYYFKGSSFRKEVKGLLSRFRRVCDDSSNNNKERSTELNAFSSSSQQPNNDGAVFYVKGIPEEQA